MARITIKLILCLCLAIPVAGQSPIAVFHANNQAYGPPPAPPSDTDANKYLFAINNSNPTFATAVTNLVISLKSAGIWAKCYAIYPFLGGTAGTQAYNLRDTMTHKLTFTGGPTHNSTGLVLSGAEYANPAYLIPNAQRDNFHVGVTTPTSASGGNFYLLGVFESPSRRTLILPRSATNTATYSVHGNGLTNTAAGTSTTSVGDWLAVRTGAAVTALYRDGVVFNSSALNSQLGTTFQPFYIGALNSGGTAGGYFTGVITFASFGQGLNATEATNRAAAISIFNTAVGH